MSAAFLKLLISLIIVLPGIAAYASDQNGYFCAEKQQDNIVNTNRAYPILLTKLPLAIEGLTFAGSTAALVASFI